MGIRLGPRLHQRHGQRYRFHARFLGFNVDYYIDRNFSVGPMMQISPMGDLFQIAFAGVGRYHLRFSNGVNLVPFFGFRLIHADLDRDTGPGSIDRNNTSWYVPVDPSVEYQVVHNIALTSTLQVIPLQHQPLPLLVRE